LLVTIYAENSSPVILTSCFQPSVMTDLVLTSIEETTSSLALISLLVLVPLMTGNAKVFKQ